MTGSTSLLKVTHVFTAAESLTFLNGQTEFMRDHGVALSAIVSPGPSADRYRRQENLDVALVDMPRRITPLEDLRAIGQIVRLLRRLQPDIVHANTPKGGLLGTLGALVARVPHRIYHMRGLPLETAHGLRWILLWSAERLTCACAHVVVAESASLRDRAIALRLSAPRKITLFANGSNGVDVEQRYRAHSGDRAAAANIRAEWGATDDDVVIGFVGRLANDKGVGELLGAWALLRERCPLARLVLVGPFDDRDPVRGERVAALREDLRVMMVGHVDDSRPYFAGFDICVLPSYREGFPNVLLEAAAMGLPIVTTRATGCVDAVVDGLTGLLVPVGAVTELADALERYCTNADLRRAHGEAGRTRVATLFNRRLVWEATLDLYRRLARVAGAPARAPREPS